MEKARLEREAALKARQEAARKKAQELEEQQMRALRAQAIANTEADIREAAELADKLAKDMEESRKEQ